MADGDSARDPVIAVVGGAGFIGRAVCAALRARGAVPLVIDRDGPAPLDIVSPAARGALAERFERERVRAVIHLAARVDPPTPRERSAMRTLHIDGTRHVIRACRDAGVARFVLASSAVVYGARPANRVPIDESAPVEPNLDFPYAVDKAAQEQIVDEEGHGLATAIARPAIVYGRGARNYLTEIIKRAPVVPALDGRRPQLQFVHVDDVARALVFLATGDAVGAYNVASADWLALEDVAALSGRRIVDVPLRAAAPILDGLARVVPPWLRAPAGMLPYLMFPFVLSSRKLASAGCAPRWSSADALATILGR